MGRTALKELKLVQADVAPGVHPAPSSFRAGVEPVQAPIEGLGKRIVGRLARREVMPADAGLAHPSEMPAAYLEGRDKEIRRL